MDLPILAARTRVLKGRKNYQLRSVAQVPAVVYGSSIKTPLSITLDRVAFSKLYGQVGESTVVELAIEGGSPVHALIQDYQTDPLRGEVIHVDFRAVDMTKSIEAEVKLKFAGDSAAVKALGGTLVTVLSTVTIRALPKDLVPFLEVRLESLATFEAAIHISDIVLPPGVTMLESSTQTVAVVAAPRSDAEMASLDEAVVTDVSTVEVAGKKKEDEETEAVEGGEEGAKGEEGKKDGKKEAPPAK